ncbi:MAG: hypothetical protein Ct9H300mP1_17870 [Planctomycetaceae bacterium]|nr:MAG: hypothetical protein Ct9H300mP1_17870 [Planctomycetaceae bacterium]
MIWRSLFCSATWICSSATIRADSARALLFLDLGGAAWFLAVISAISRFCFSSASTRFSSSSYSAWSGRRSAA